MSDQILHALPGIGLDDGRVFSRIRLPLVADRARVEDVAQ